MVNATARVDGAMGHGRDELSRIIGQWLASFEGWREEIEEMRDLGDQAYVVALQGGRGQDSGLETQTRYAVMYEVRGRAIRLCKPPVSTTPEMPKARPSAGPPD